MNIPDNIKLLIKSVAPTLLTALSLPPPLNLIAATVVSGILNKYLPENVMQHTDNAGNSINPAAMTPEQIVTVINDNQTSPAIVSDLKNAEESLRQYELTSGIRFAELALQEKQSIQDFQINSGIAGNVFNSGIKIVWVAMGGLLIVVVIALLLLIPGISIPEGKQSIVTAVFGIIGTVIGFINGLASNIVGYYWGSSQGSKDKGIEMASSFKALGDSVAKSLESKTTPTNTPPSAVTTGEQPKAASTSNPPYSGDISSPPNPAKKSLLMDTKSELVTPHNFIKSGVNWSLQKEGISIDGTLPTGTQGKPTTVEKIWDLYGQHCLQASKMYGVPVELIIATIATESGGDKNARRPEPQINDESVGLMQTLVKTARGALGRPSLSGDDLLDPATSIEAGTAYIAHQRFVTHFDPPKVAAAYNAGSLRVDNADANRWKMHCFPKGTGRHIDNYVAWFNDCMKDEIQSKLDENNDVSTFGTIFK
ncbi:lytic transglycosylase domain-containing protein [Buttiauxella sp. B2]|uniref:lytic transglycosylase domain-containing protein n=1 Tax=Buttiauxella sp. B2 TaxID=2587812 RepID=UPI001678B7DF|nr:transglycosylase SLT domain-containing protein [Buttiauxella sp. B2]